MATGQAGGWRHWLLLLLLALPAAWVLRGAVLEVSPTGVTSWAPGAAVLGLHALARRYPLQLVTASKAGELHTSTTFGLALLLLVPTPLAVLGLTLAALVPLRERHGSTVWHLVHEPARAALAFGTAGWVLGLLERVAAGWNVDAAGRSWYLLVLILPVGLAASLVEFALAALGTAVRQGASLRAVVHEQRARIDLAAHLLLIALAPAVVVLSEGGLLLLPLLLLAIVGLYRSSRVVAVQQHAATHDALTGLANRRHLEERLSTLIDAATLDDRFALLLMDLDRFKEVNDRLGHHVGDQLLAEVGARLGRLDGLDLAARIGGDEFAFVVRRAGEHADLVAAAERLVNVVSRPYVVSEVRLAIGASIGVAVFPDHGLDGPSLLRRADSAMYAAKRSGVPVGVATVQRDGAAPGRVSLLGELEEAMRRGQLRLDYQPQVDLRTGEVTGVESLLRWHHPEHGLVSPQAFITTVEHTELIAPLTRHVIRLALDDAERWATAGVRVPVSVNISARDLTDRRFPRDLADQLTARDHLPVDVTLEITETALQHDPAGAAQILGELRDLGVGLAIDDFGTGYSSLARLRTLPVTELKIDRTFVVGMAESGGAAIVRSVIGLAHALGLLVVAEGVEDDAELAQLQRYGCDRVQGFLLARPLPAHLVAPWVRARRAELQEARGPFAALARSADAPSDERPAIRAV